MKNHFPRPAVHYLAPVYLTFNVSLIGCCVYNGGRHKNKFLSINASIRFVSLALLFNNNNNNNKQSVILSSMYRLPKVKTAVLCHDNVKSFW